MIRTCRTQSVRNLSLSALVLATCAAVTASAQNPSPQFPKRGLGASLNLSTNTALVKGMNSNWYYTWGRTPNLELGDRGGEFIPMAWNGNSISNPASFQQLLGHKSDYIMGFNEPERAEQANMTVAQAIALWPQLMATGKKLVSPASDRVWLTEFMSEINRLNYRVDAIAFHWYGDIRTNPAGAASGLISNINWFHNNFTNNAGQKYPIWLTEFAGLDFTEGANPVTPAMNEAFLSVALPQLDALPHLERYAWFPHRTEAALGTGTSVFTPNGSGHLYNGRTYNEGQTYSVAGDEGIDTFYLRGGSLQNSTTDKILQCVDVMEGTSDVNTTAKLDIRNGWLRIRSGATLEKLGSSTFEVYNSKLFNDGTLTMNAGVFRLSDGTVVEGTGTIRVRTGSQLSITGSNIKQGVLINNRIWLSGGQIFANTGSHTLDGQLDIANNTSFAMNGNFTVNAPMVGAGTLTKTGTGTFRLNAGSTNTGAFTISGGTLLVANSTGSAHGTGLLTISTSSTLAGDGKLGGSGVVLNGTVAPSDASGLNRPMSFTAPLTFAATAKAKISVGITAGDDVLVLPKSFTLDEEGDFDLKYAVTNRITSTSSIVVDGTLELSQALLAPELIPMTVITAANLTGTFDTVTGTAIAGQPNRALAVTYTNKSVIVTKTILGDINVNGIVDFEDLLSMAENYDSLGKTWIDGDMNGDSLVDFTDLKLLARNYGTVFEGLEFGEANLEGELTGAFASEWNRALATVIVPEPGSLMLLPGLMLLSQRRR